MTGRRGADGLGPEDRALWRKVAATVRPLEGREADAPPIESPVSRQPPSSPRRKPESGPAVELDPGFRRGDGRGKVVAARAPSDTLDGGWDRRLQRGVVAPDRTIDLHGHTLASAHAALDHALESALVDEARVLLLVTGKPPREGATRARGLIRANIGDWLATSCHASRIAAVRNAHPRHGGQGALYVILRRRREGR